MAAAGRRVGGGAEVSHVFCGVDCGWNGAWRIRCDGCVFAVGSGGHVRGFFACYGCGSLDSSFEKMKECVHLKPAGLTIVPEEIK
jgi:hypothetical protein